MHILLLSKSHAFFRANGCQVSIVSVDRYPRWTEMKGMGRKTKLAENIKHQKKKKFHSTSAERLQITSPLIYGDRFHVFTCYVLSMLSNGNLGFTQVHKGLGTNHSSSCNIPRYEMIQEVLDIGCSIILFPKKKKNVCREYQLWQKCIASTKAVD